MQLAWSVPVFSPLGSARPCQVDCHAGGFSQILNNLNAPFVSVNILEDEMLRSGLKEYSSWPTFPQLYIDGAGVAGLLGRPAGG